MVDQDRLIRLLEVEQRFGLSRSTIYRLMREDRFPLPIRVGPRAVRWSLAELEAWVAAQPRATGEDRRGPKPTRHRASSPLEKASQSDRDRRSS